MDAFGAQAPLFTYPQLQNVLRIEFARARRYSYPLCCLVAQVDGIERLRDLHGSAFRDEVVRRVVAAVRAQTRASDSIGVYQDRIAILLPHTTIEGAGSAANRLRAAVAREAFRAGSAELRLSVSAGLAAFQERGTIFFDSVLKAAEGALVQALTAGGDRVLVAAPSPPPTA